MLSVPRRDRIVRIVVLLAVLTLLGVGAYWYYCLAGSPSPAPTTPLDPRLTFPTPFRNVHPDVKYVGDAACSVCHTKIDQCYHQHPMGRSAARAETAGPLEKYDAAFHNPIQTKTHTLTILNDGGRIRHRITGNTPETADVPAYEVPVDIMIGSGTRGRSYLTVDRGSVWQTPISWFTDDDRWNLSPGFDLGLGGRRAIVADCLFCHVDRTDPVPHSTNLYQQVLVGQANVGCERCHGPGELHVEYRTNGGTETERDDTIVNPKHLTPQLQMDICRQCHLMGEQRVDRRGRNRFEYRPGLPLDLFVNVFVRHPDQVDIQRSVGQFEQMERSVCFTRSDGAMTCTSCHDPHQVPAKDEVAAFYRNKCLTCHDSRGCSQPEPVRQEKGNSCIACHMPRRDSTSIAHAVVTDHRIPRRASDAPRKPAATIPGDVLPLVPYRIGPHAPSPEELDRDLGLALANSLSKLIATDPTSRFRLSTTTAEKLQAAVNRWPDDAAAWHMLSATYSSMGDTPKQLNAIRKAAELQPNSEVILAAQAATEMSARSYRTAREITDQLIQMNPAAVEYRIQRAKILLSTHELAAADQACHDALAINPMSAEAHILRAKVLDGLGRTIEAQKEADVAISLEANPQVQQQLRQWFRGSR
jgi:Flp pilus assembly protein TadD